MENKITQLEDLGYTVRIGERRRKNGRSKRKAVIEIKIGRDWVNINHRRARQLLNKNKDKYESVWALGMGEYDAYIIYWRGHDKAEFVKLEPYHYETREEMRDRLGSMGIENPFFRFFDTEDELMEHYTNPEKLESWIFKTESGTWDIHILNEGDLSEWNEVIAAGKYNPNTDRERILKYAKNREKFLDQRRERRVRKSLFNENDIVLRDTNAPLFRSHILGEIDSELNSMCVPDLICACLGSEVNGKRVMITSNSRKRILEEMIDNYGDEYTLGALEESLEDNDITSFVFDASMKLVFKYVSKNRHFLYPAICLFHNEHVYPISNKRVIDKVMNGIELGDTLYSVLKLPTFDDNMVYKDELVEEYNMHVGNVEDFKQLVRDYLANGNIPGCIKADDRGGLVAYYDEINNCNVILNPYVEYIEEAGDKCISLLKDDEKMFEMDISWEWEGEDICSYVEKLFKLMEGNFDCYKGLLNPIQYDRLFKFTMCPVKFMRRDAENATFAYDVNGAYRYAVSMGEDLEAGIFDLFCDWRVYDGEEINDVGQYLVEYIDMGWCRFNHRCISGKTVKWGLERGYVGRIIEYCLPVRKMNFLAWKRTNELVDKLFSEVEDAKLRKKLVKMPVNRYVGKVGMWEVKKRISILGRVLDGLEGFNQCFSFNDKFEVDDVIMGQKVERKRLDRTSRAVHLAVIEFNIRRLDSIIKKIEGMGGTIYGVKTDCIYTDIDLEGDELMGDEDGKLKREMISVCGYRSKFFEKGSESGAGRDSIRELKIESVESGNVNLDNGNIVIDSFAGYGKTYCVRKYLGNTDERFVITSCANNPLTNYGNINKCKNIMNTTELFMCNFGNIERKLKDIRRVYDVLILEEFSMTPIEHMEYIYLLWKMGIRIIFVGSGFQLGNMDARYVAYGRKKEIFKIMFDRLIELKWHPLCRMSALYDKFLRQFRIDGILRKSDFKLGDVKSKKTHLVYTNTRRKFVNSHFSMEEGCPIICKKNYKHLGVYNNMTGKYIGGKYVFGDTIVDEKIDVELGYAFTVHSAQGMTLDKVVVHQADFHRVDRNWMNVNLSRVRCMEDIEFIGLNDDLKLEFREESVDVLHWRKSYKDGYIYCLKRGDSVFYVGSTDDLKARFSAHKATYGDCTMEVLNKYKFINRNELRRKEYYFIDKFIKEGHELENVKKWKADDGYLECAMRKYLLPLIYKKSIEADRFVVKECVLSTDKNGNSKYIWKNIYFKKKPRGWDLDKWKETCKKLDIYLSGKKDVVMERIEKVKEATF